MPLMKVIRCVSRGVLQALALLVSTINAQAESTHLEVASFPQINRPTWVIRTTAHRKDEKSKWQPATIHVYQRDNQASGTSLNPTALVAEGNQKKYFLGLQAAWQIRRENIAKATGVLSQFKDLAETARKTNVKELRKELGFLPHPPVRKSGDTSDNTIPEITGDTLYFDVRNEQGLTKHSILIARPGGDESGERLNPTDVATLLELLAKLPASETQFAPLPAAPVKKEIPAPVAPKFMPASATVGGWTAYGEGKSPWTVQERSCEDGQAAQLRSSLPLGEQLTGSLRSPLFIAPEKLRFYVCGHDEKRNFVRLVDPSGKVLRQAVAPGSDTAKRIEWDLTGISGHSVRIEATDGANGSGYAWIAFGRFKPELPQLVLTKPTTDRLAPPKKRPKSDR